MHKSGVKAIVLANTPENQRISKSVFKVTRIIDKVDNIPYSFGTFFSQRLQVGDQIKVSNLLLDGMA